MPVRRRVSAMPRTAQPDPTDPWTWGNGDGTDTFSSIPRYRTVEAATRAWDRVGRVATWAAEGVGRVPAGAKHYDHLSDEAYHTTFRTSMMHEVYPESSAVKVREAVARDRAKVEAFRLAQPKAYRQIAPYLRWFLWALDQWAEDARVSVGKPSSERYRMDLSAMRFTGIAYGDADERSDELTNKGGDSV